MSTYWEICPDFYERLTVGASGIEKITRDEKTVTSKQLAKIIAKLDPWACLWFKHGAVRVYFSSEGQK